MNSIGALNPVTPSNALTAVAQNAGQMARHTVRNITSANGLGSFCQTLGDGFEKAFVVVKNAVVTASLWVWKHMQTAWSAIQTAYKNNPKLFLYTGVGALVGAAVTGGIWACYGRSRAAAAATQATADANAAANAAATNAAAQPAAADATNVAAPGNGVVTVPATVIAPPPVVVPQPTVVPAPAVTVAPVVVPNSAAGTPNPISRAVPTAANRAQLVAVRNANLPPVKI